jgi:hypothetical protein
MSIPAFIHRRFRLSAVLALISGPAAFAGTLVSVDFNAANPWTATDVSKSSNAIAAEVSWKPVGTIDEAGTANTTGALRFTADSTKAGKTWGAAFLTGPIPVTNTETDLAKLTLGFMLAASDAKPVIVRIESLNAKGKRTGGLEGVIYPAAANFYQRYSLDLSTLKPFGSGKFKPADPAIRLTFGIARGSDGRGWAAAAGHELRLDNVSYASPAFYVSPKGDDSNDGRTEKTAFATPQAAVNAAGPGYIILLGEGTYNGGLTSTVSFRRAGSPAAWIVLKNHPGQKPVLTGNAWNIVSLAFGSKQQKDTENSLGYIEIRGLHVRGDGDVVKEKFPDAVGKSDSRSNSNGIAVDGRYMTNVPHHIRIADCLVEYAPSQGIGSIEGDYLFIENNISRYNCWHTIYASSGFSVMGSSNFDTADNIYKTLIRGNVAYRNETMQQWAEVKRISDGNGFIIDVNQGTVTHPNINYIGRTLVINNLAYDNGGSGIHTVRADRVDIINNTAYLNSASPALQYSQIYSWGSKDVRIMNNILVAPVADVSKGEKPEPVNRLAGPNKDVIFSHNLYFGGNIPPKLGEGDRIGDPRFVNASIDPKVANFRLRPDSPAVDAATADAPALPWFDLDGNVRPQGRAYDLGAYELPVKR